MTLISSSQSERGNAWKSVCRRNRAGVPVTVFDIRGEITADTAARFREEADRAMAGGAQNLVLDLTNVPYIGSFGLRALNDILKGLHKGASDQNEAQLRQALRDGRSKVRAP